MSPWSLSAGAHEKRQEVFFRAFLWSLSCKKYYKLRSKYGEVLVKILKIFALVPVCAVCTVSAERGT
jgi:hypothetical protein